MDKTETYNGYTNYETWGVKLVIDNTESLYNFFENYKQEILDKEEDQNQRIAKLQHVLEQVVDNLQPQNANDMWNQLMGAARSRINFYEIAKVMMEEAA